MQEPNQDASPTVPPQPEATAPLKKSLPIVIALAAIVAVIGIANLSSLVTGNKRNAPAGAMPIRPTSASPQQVNSFETQQQLQARRDADAQLHQQELSSLQRQLREEQAVPGPEAPGTAPMTEAQRTAIYGESPNGPKQTSNVSQAHAEAKERVLAREKQRQDAVNSDTVAIDFAHPNVPDVSVGESGTADIREQDLSQTSTAVSLAQDVAGDPPKHSLGAPSSADQQTKASEKNEAIAKYDFDAFQGQLYRVFEGTVLEGVVTNHIDAGLPGPILLMLTTDYYSHDHQQLLMPQGTRLIGNVQSVGNIQQQKIFVTFHRAVCPDGFSLDFDKYIGLDPIGTTGLATKVDHGYFQAFAAAAAVGGLGGLAQIGNNGSVLSSSTEIRNGISQQSAAEGEQTLNHFLNRLPVITLKEGSRARVYIVRDILIPSYAEHRVDPTL